MTGNEGKEIWETNLTRQMVCYTEPSGELSLDTVWKRASTFKKTWTNHLFNTMFQGLTLTHEINSRRALLAKTVGK